MNEDILKRLEKLEERMDGVVNRVGDIEDAMRPPKAPTKVYKPDVTDYRVVTDRILQACAIIRPQVLGRVHFRMLSRIAFLLGIKTHSHLGEYKPEDEEALAGTMAKYMSSMVVKDPNYGIMSRGLGHYSWNNLGTISDEAKKLATKFYFDDEFVPQLVKYAPKPEHKPEPVAKPEPKEANLIELKPSVAAPKSVWNLLIPDDKIESLIQEHRVEKFQKKKGTDKGEWPVIPLKILNDAKAPMTEGELYTALKEVIKEDGPMFPTLDGFRICLMDMVSRGFVTCDKSGILPLYDFNRSYNAGSWESSVSVLK